MRDFLVAAVLLALPVLLIARQPDLGTAVLVAAVGFYVIFFAGIGWKVLVGLGCSARRACFRSGACCMTTSAGAS